MIEAADEQALELTRRGSIAFSRMERNGIRMDVPYLDRMIKETGEKIQELEAKLQQDEVFELWKKRHGSKAKIGSRKQLADVIYTGLGIECKAFTDSGTPSTDVEAFEDIDLLFVKRWANYTKLIKLRSTSLVSFRKAICNGFLRPSFNLHTTKTYRASASDPNTTNIPNREPKQSKIVRPAFIPRSEEHVILETDISGAEVRAAACYHHDPVMLDYINDPSKDMHRDMAGECYRLNPEQVSKPIRGAAKAMFVFAEFYGDWWFKVCQNMWHAVDREKLTLVDGTPLRDHLNSVGLDKLGNLNPKQPLEGSFEQHIQEVEDRFWCERFIDYTKWKTSWWNAYLDKGYFKTKTGFVCAGVYGRNECINYPIQGTAFHWLLWILIEVDEWLTKNKMKSLVIGQIHDSMLIDCHRSEIQDVLFKIKELVGVGLRKHWPWIIVPVEIENSVCEENWYGKVEWTEQSGVWKPKQKKAG